MLIRNFIRARESGLAVPEAIALAEARETARRKATPPARQPAAAPVLQESLEQWQHRHQAANHVDPSSSDLVAHRRLLTVRKLDTVADVLAESREPSRERSAPEDLQAWKRLHQRTA